MSPLFVQNNSYIIYIVNFSKQSTAPSGYALLYSYQDIQNKAYEIVQDLAESHTLDKMIPIIVLGGAMEWSSVLLPELYRQGLNTERYFLQAKSYHGKESGNCTVEFVTPGLDDAVRGRTALLIEDIVDTGNTMNTLTPLLYQKGAKDIIVISMLSKPSKKNPDIDLSNIEILPAFEIPGEHFVIGFGLDINGKHRHFPGICIPE